MNITRLVEKIFIRSFLIVTLFALQSCSNTLIGEKLESSFDSMEKPRTPEKTNIKLQKPNEKTKIKSRIKDKKKRELVDTRNQADGLINESEKNIKEHGDKVSEGDKKKIEEDIEELKKVKDGEDLELIKSKTEF